MNLAKIDIITAAFTEIGLVGYAADATPDELTAASTQLDRMIGKWAGDGLPVRFTTGSTSLTAKITIPEWAAEAIVLNLAIRMAPSFGRTAMPATKADAAQALETVRKRSVIMQPMPIDNQVAPAGAGNRWPFRVSPYLADATQNEPVALDLILNLGSTP